MAAAHLFPPEFLYRAIAKLYSDHWVRGIALPATALIFQILYNSFSATKGRVKCVVLTTKNANALTDSEGRARDVLARWVCADEFLRFDSGMAVVKRWSSALGSLPWVTDQRRGRPDRRTAQSICYSPVVV